MNGVININKKLGITSFDVVRIVKRLSKEKKVGHTGTLDPEASGVLPVCLGKATKIIDYIMENVKTYKVKFQVGIVTDTYDLEGKILAENNISCITEEMVKSSIKLFQGLISQVPPMYSALKVNGKRLYELARQGIEVEREARNVTIYNIDNIEIQLPYVSMEVTCSKGTYIRSLCYDIGKNLGVGATMVSLCRTKNGPFTIENSIHIDDLSEDNLLRNIMSIDEALQNFPCVNIKDEKFSKLLKNGVNICDRAFLNSINKNYNLCKVYDENNILIGVGRLSSKGFKIEKLLLDWGQTNDCGRFQRKIIFR